MKSRRGEKAPENLPEDSRASTMELRNFWILRRKRWSNIWLKEAEKAIDVFVELLRQSITRALGIQYYIYNRWGSKNFACLGHKFFKYI